MGKDKYIQFQLEWHQCCSVCLLPPASWKKLVWCIGIWKRKWSLPTSSSDGLDIVREAVPTSILGMLWWYQFAVLCKTSLSLQNASSSCCFAHKVLVWCMNVAIHMIAIPLQPGTISLVLLGCWRIQSVISSKRFPSFSIMYEAIVTVKVVKTYHRRLPLVQGGLELPSIKTL